MLKETAGNILASFTSSMPPERAAPGWPALCFCSLLMYCT